MSVYRDTNGTWRFRVTAHNRLTGDRKRLSGTPTINTRREAELAERQAVMMFEAPPAPGTVKVESITFAELAEEYQQRHLARAKVSTQKKMWATVRNHLLPAFGELSLDGITAEHLDKLATHLLTTPRLPRGAEIAKIARGCAVDIQDMRSPRTVHDIFDTLHAMFVLAREWGRMATIPKFPKLPKLTDRTAPAHLSYDEEARMYAIATPSDRLLIKFAIRTGLRAGEQLAIRWSDIDLVNKVIKVERNYHDGILTSTKGNRTRFVPLDDDLAAELQQIIAVHDLVFCDVNGGYLSLSILNRTLQRVAAAAGIAKHVHWHMLRHTFGTHMVAGGVPLTTVQGWMGHASVQQTETYAHAMACMERTFVDRAARARQQALTNAVAA